MVDGCGRFSCVTQHRLAGNATRLQCSKNSRCAEWFSCHPPESLCFHSWRVVWYRTRCAGYTSKCSPFPPPTGLSPGRKRLHVFFDLSLSHLFSLNNALCTKHTSNVYSAVPSRTCTPHTLPPARDIHEYGRTVTTRACWFTSDMQRRRRATDMFNICPISSRSDLRVQRIQNGLLSLTITMQDFGRDTVALPMTKMPRNQLCTKTQCPASPLDTPFGRKVYCTMNISPPFIPANYGNFNPALAARCHAALPSR